MTPEDPQAAPGGTRTPGNRVRVVATLIVLAAATGAAVVLALFLVRQPDDTLPVPFNRLAVEVHACPAGASAAGTNLSRTCTGAVPAMTVEVVADGFERRIEDVTDRFAIETLPSGDVRLTVADAPPGSVGLLSCRSYAQDERDQDALLSLAPEVAYRPDPMSASLLLNPYIVLWPDSRWAAIPADPTDAQLDEAAYRYGASVRCDWFLLPPGETRPGIVRNWPGTDVVREPALHVVGPGGGGAPGLGNATPAPGGPIPGGFTYRSLAGDGTTITLDGSTTDVYALSPGSWTVTDKVTGETATVDLAPGQTVRVISVRSVDDGSPNSTTSVSWVGPATGSPAR